MVCDEGWKISKTFENPILLINKSVLNQFYYRVVARGAVLSLMHPVPGEVDASNDPELCNSLKLL